MKNLFFSLSFLCLSISISAQLSSVEDFCKQYSGMEEVTSLNFSGPLINFIFSQVETEETELVSKITNVRLLLVEKGEVVSLGAYKKLIKSVKRDDFEEFMRLKDDGQSIDFYLREDGDTITDVLITVYGDDGFVLLSLEGAFKFSDLNDFNLDVQGAEHLKKLPENKKKKRARIDRA